MKKNALLIDEKISVIVPIYNSQNTLSDCIHSILGQTYNNFELLLVDDGSSDDSLKICKEFEGLDQRIKIFSQQNMGPSAARNIGIINSKGKYLLFVDSDDYIENNMFHELIYNAEENNADFVMCGLIVDVYNTSGELVSSTKCELKPRLIEQNDEVPENIIDLVENEKISGPYCKLIRRDIVINNNILMPAHINLQEDLYFNLKVLEHVNKMMVLEGCYYHYKKGQTDSITSRYYHSKYDMTNEVHDLLVKFYSLRCDDIDLQKRINYIYIKNTYAAFINLFHPDCNMSKDRKIKYMKNIINSLKYSYMISSAYKRGLKYTILILILKTKNTIILYYSSKFMFILKFKLGFAYQPSL